MATAVVFEDWLSVANKSPWNLLVPPVAPNVDGNLVVPIRDGSGTVHVGWCYKDQTAHPGELMWRLAPGVDKKDALKCLGVQHGFHPRHAEIDYDSSSQSWKVTSTAVSSKGVQFDPEGKRTVIQFSATGKMAIPSMLSTTHVGSCALHIGTKDENGRRLVRLSLVA